MSTNWGYHCATCDVSTAHWWNHGDEQLTVLAQHWSQIKPLYDLTQGNLLWRIEILVVDWYDAPNPLTFLSEHSEHHMMLENEYGDREEMPKVNTP